MAECSPPNTPRTECDPDLCSDEYGTDDDAADDDDVRNSGGGGDGQGETAASLSTNPIEVLIHSLPFPRFLPSPALISRVLHKSPHRQAPHRRADEQEDGGVHHYEAAGLEAVLCHDKVENVWSSWFGHNIIPCAVERGTRIMLAFKHDTMHAHSAF